VPDLNVDPVLDEAFVIAIQPTPFLLVILSLLSTLQRPQGRCDAAIGIALLLGEGVKPHVVFTDAEIPGLLVDL
jgi:hypothetical protein